MFTILVARIYDPSTYGEFAAVLALSSVFIGVSTLRLEVRAHGIEGSEKPLFRLALVVAAIVSIPILILSAVAVLLGADIVWLFCAPMVYIGSVQLVRSAQLVYGRRYLALATNNFAQGASMGSTQYILGLAAPASATLAVGFLVSRLTWIKGIGVMFTNVEPLLVTFKSHWRYAVVAGTTALINSAAGQLPVLLIVAVYSSVEAGLFAMMLRLLVSPLAVIGRAAGATSIGEVGKLVRRRQPGARRFIARASMELAIAGLVPCLIVGFAGPWIATTLMGGEWRGAGVLMAIMSVGAFGQFVASPFSQLLNVVGASRSLLVWDLVRLLLFAGAIALPAAFGQSFTYAIGVYSLMHVPVYGLLLMQVWTAIGRIGDEE
ncbi:lipopolysaccharide biosynthesis protein [Georgenia sp. Z1344]|uniref:lipopolysaccharide biosynthesis protein n=1 Tax=Georgenia sp. Z1344 TaxID=3416706 RepID=UPI003CED7412